MGMGTRRRRQRQERLWISHNELVNGQAHPFYKRVNELLEKQRVRRVRREGVREILRREQWATIGD